MTMKRIDFKHGNISQSDVLDIVLLANHLSDDEKTALSENVDLPLVDGIADDKITAVLAKDFANYENSYLLLTADDNEDELSQILDIKRIQNILVYVKDFKDGRVFSLIRQIRKTNETADIIVSGKFGLDQSNYFVKSGANAFIVADDKIETLIRTLNDLSTAQSRQSVSSLPMFR